MNLKEWAARRKRFMQSIGPSGIAILVAAPIVYRNADSEYSYRQNSDFYYLTGFEEPESVAVFLSSHSGDGEFILFVRPRDRAEEVWSGRRAGIEGALHQYGANQAFSIQQLQEKLPELIDGRECIYYALGTDPKFDPFLITLFNKMRGKIRSGAQPPLALLDTSQKIHEMRLIKSEEEIQCMRKAAEISAAAHVHAMQTCRPGQYEYELEAEITYTFLKAGARSSAYPTIVGSGPNSCILHYNTNNKKMDAKDIVLIDAGCEYQYYASDITRTFPVGGVFSAEQKAIYDIVLAAQLAGIEAVAPGQSWHTPQEHVIKIITQGLMDLGILKGSLNELIETEAYFPFYMHRSGHWLGLDVHDVGRYKVEGAWRAFGPGMVLTVEPGIYISSDLPHVDSRWHNIGIRIEDDVLVSSTGHEVLSEKAVKTIPDIEALMR